MLCCRPIQTLCVQGNAQRNLRSACLSDSPLIGLLWDRRRGLRLGAFHKTSHHAAQAFIHYGFVDLFWSPRVFLLFLNESTHFFSFRPAACLKCFLKACSLQVRGRALLGKLFFLFFFIFFFLWTNLPELCFPCTPPLLTTMDLVWIVGFVVSVCAWFASAERHSVYWNSTNPK